MSRASKVLGEKLREAREKIGYTQYVVAMYVGLKDEKSISKYENGRLAVPAERLVELCDLLDLNIDEMIVLRSRVEQEKIVGKVYGKECIQ